MNRKLSQKQRRTTEKGMMSLGMLVNGLMPGLFQIGSASKVDFAEIACAPSSSLTAGMQQEGFKCQRINLEQGYDLHKLDDCNRAKDWFEKSGPRKSWFSLPCTYFSPMQNLTPEPSSTAGELGERPSVEASSSPDEWTFRRHGLDLPP